MKKKYIGWVAVSALCLCLGGKPTEAINPGDILGGAKDVIDVVQAFSINDKQEVAIGAQIHPQLLAQMGGAHPNKGLQSYLNQIGQRLVKFSGRKNIPYHFTVVNTSEANAFAIPGGYVYVTKGLLKMMRDEAELASVVGHEIGHVVGKHGVKKMQQTVIAQKAVGHLGRLGQPVVDELSNLFANLWLTGYGREAELASDRMGLHMANDAGYDPNGAVRLFKHLMTMEGGGSGNPMNSLFASHPPTKKRLDLAEKEIKTLARKGTKVNAGQYMAVRNRMGR